MELTAPWPPTQNHCYFTTKQGKRILTAAAKAYVATVKDLATCDTFRGCREYLVVEATYYKPDRRKRDTDNVRKVLADAVADGLGVDDSQFLWRDQAIRVDRTAPRVELVIYQESE